MLADAIAKPFKSCDFTSQLATWLNMLRLALLQAGISSLETHCLWSLYLCRSMLIYFFSLIPVGTSKEFHEIFITLWFFLSVRLSFPPLQSKSLWVIPGMESVLGNEAQFQHFMTKLISKASRRPRLLALRFRSERYFTFPEVIVSLIIPTKSNAKEKIAKKFRVKQTVIT